MVLQIEQSVSTNFLKITSCQENGHDLVHIEVFSEKGPRGSASKKLAGLRMPRDKFLDMLTTLWPENVAYEFKDLNE